MAEETKAAVDSLDRRGLVGYFKASSEALCLMMALKMLERPQGLLRCSSHEPQAKGPFYWDLREIKRLDGMAWSLLAEHRVALEANY